MRRILLLLLQVTAATALQAAPGSKKLCVDKSEPPWHPTPTLALHSAALIWGSQHSVVKTLVEQVDSPPIVNAARFLLAASLTAPWWPAIPSRNSQGQRTWKAGLELGFLMWLGFALQAAGLADTTATRSAFLLYLNVKLVPILALVLYGRESSKTTWISAALAFCGTALISSDGSPPSIGDAYSLAAAAASALFILRLEAACKPTNNIVGAELNSATLVTCGALCALWGWFELLRLDPSSAANAIAALQQNSFQVAYLAVFVTLVANWLQTYGQSSVPSQNAALIFSLDPVYGAVFAWALLGERLNEQGFLGVLFVLTGVIISACNGEPRASSNLKDE